VHVRGQETVKGRTPRETLRGRRCKLERMCGKGGVRDIKNWRPVSLLCYDYNALTVAFVTAYIYF